MTGKHLLGACLLCACIALPCRATPLNSAFTYRGRLQQAGQPAEGSFDLEFRLFATPTGGTAIGTAR